MDFLTCFNQLQRFRPELTTLNIVLVSRPTGSRVKRIALKSYNDLPKDRHTSHIYINLEENSVTIDKVEIANPHIAFEGLFFNKSVQFSNSALKTAAITLLENKFMYGLERSSMGWPTLTREEFITRLTEIDFLTYFNQLQRMRPELTTLKMALVSRHQGTTVKGISLISANDLPKARGPSIIHIHVDENVVTIDLVEKAMHHIAYEGLFFNKNVRLTNLVLQAGAATLLENKFMQGKKRISRGWPPLTLEEFITKLSEIDFLIYFNELQRVRPVLTSLNMVLVSYIQGSRVGGISLKSADKLPKSHQFSYTHLKLSQQAVIITSVEKSNKSQVYNALTKNTTLTIDPLLAARMRTISPEDRLLFRLSEFGRGLLLNELRRQYFDSIEDSAAHDVFESVTETEFHRAAYQVLVRLGTAFVADQDQDQTWPDDDQRYTVAQELHYFLAETPLPPEYAGLVSDLLLRAEFIFRERELTDYRRALRDAGSAPISEMGWDDVFSEELRIRLRTFANDYFELAGIANPAQAYLRDPYNEALGAFYWQLYKEGNLALRTEILIHIRHQRNRGDALTEFYDGLHRQSGRMRENAIALIQHDLHGLEEQYQVWNLNVEAPFRLINGIVSGAARFLWHRVFDEVTQDLLIGSARTLFPNHTFDNEDDLSKRLPQSLFFEVLGNATQAATQNKPHAPSFEEGIRRLHMLMGIGDTTQVSFRRGFGAGSLINLLGEIVDELMDKYPTEFREYLEGNWTYERNEINQFGEYQRVPVELRRGEILERLFQGYDLRNLSGTLAEFPRIIRGFRLGHEQNEMRLLRRIKMAWEDYEFDGAMDQDDARLIAEQLRLWSASPDLVAAPGSRWYLFEQWLTRDGQDWETFFEEVYAVVEELI